MEVLTLQWWLQSSRRLKIIRVRYTTSYYQILITHLQWKLDCYHHNTGHRPGKREEIHTVLPTLVQL
jgi:hypothetical protein